MYVYLVSDYRLSKQIKQQSNAFSEGLSEMIDQKWLRCVFVPIMSSVSIPFSSLHNNYIDFSRMFNQQEVQILIGGVNSPIDLDDLRRHTNYGRLYDDNHKTIIFFGNVSCIVERPDLRIDSPLLQVVNSFDQE